MNIGTTILVGYDLCKNTLDAETCRQRAMSAAPEAVSLLLQSYDACIPVMGADRCRSIFAPDVPASPVVPFIGGLVIGVTLLLLIFPVKKPSKQR